MRHLKNCWYAAAWGREVTREFLTRTLLELPILLFRRQDGRPVALLDRCPHRFAPLHMGKLLGDVVECAYHGLQFDCSGVCVKNPHGDGRIPALARTREFPAADRHGLIWLWMGDPALADPDTIPDYKHLTSPLLKTVGDQMTQEAHYELIVDNLMDLSHVNYIHAPYQQVDDFLKADHQVVQNGNQVESRRTIPSTRAPRSFQPFMQDPDAPVEYWLNIVWNAPGTCQLETGVTPVGRPRSEGLVRIGTHIVSPETELRSRYFYASSRNYRLDDPAADEETRQWQQVGFHEQDKPIIEAAQSRMTGSDLMAMKPLLLATDAAAMRVRRLLSAMIAAEESAAVAQPGSVGGRPRADAGAAA